MALAPFEPGNAIERRIALAQTGGLDGDALMREMLDADLYMPSTDPVQPDGSGLRPVIQEQDEFQFVTVFTALARQPADMGGHTLRLTGRQLFQRLPLGYGVAINPGCDAQILLPPHGAAALKADILAG